MWTAEIGRSLAKKQFLAVLAVAVGARPDE